MINEIHHDPDIKTELAEFIELHNSGDEPANLSGWTIGGAVVYTIPEGTQLDGGAFAVIAHNPTQFRDKFGGSPLGPWLGKLDNDGERIELREATGQLVDRVRYRLGFPWPIVGAPP
ncbi:MAG TPA: lamin tail domain-containing protein, partial [Verrucomicrobiota bacterium]|nr:lamin tail domain-containing protein [Verrucomicrobiota bacterium]